MKHEKSKRIMQNVSFNSLEDFYAALTGEERAIVLKLREIIYSVIPHCTEKLSFNVPYFRLRRSVCFIWPSLVQWGDVKQSGVRLGFAKGYLLDDVWGYLDKGKRKQIYWREIETMNEIDEEIIAALLIQAALLDEERYG